MYCVPRGASMLIGIKTRRNSYLSWLVVSFNPSEKYDFVSWDDYSQYIYIYIWKNKIHGPNHQPVSYLEKNLPVRDEH